MLLTIPGAYAFDYECEHEWHEVAGPPSQSVGDITETTHSVITYVTWGCVKCGRRELRPSTAVPPRVVAHVMDCIDKGHGVGDQHFYLFRCTGCGYEKLVTASCDGPPCPVNVVNALPDDEEEQDA